MNSERGKFVVLEGLDGSGKTTQAKMLAEALQTLGYEVVLTREPGGTESTVPIRRLIMDPEVNKNAKVALCLFLADRALHLAEVIVPALQSGKIIVCDRYEASTIAYQGFGEGLDISRIRDFNNFVTGGLRPDLTIVIDILIGESRERAQTGGVNHYDERPLGFYEEVRRGFLWQAELPKNEKSWVVIDGGGSVEAVHERVVLALKEHGIIENDDA